MNAFKNISIILSFSINCVHPKEMPLIKSFLDILSDSNLNISYSITRLCSCSNNIIKEEAMDCLVSLISVD